jgi:putative ABC transport system ATP-binding protein
VYFDLDEAIIRQGDPAEDFFVIVAGAADVYVTDPHGNSSLIRTLRAGDEFGEIGILERRPRTATVRAAKSEPVTLLRLTREKFEQMLRSSTTASTDLALIAEQRLLDSLDLEA